MEIQASDWPFVLLLVPLVSRQNGAFKLQNNFKYQELRYVGNGAGHISLAEERNHRGAERFAAFDGSGFVSRTMSG